MRRFLLAALPAILLLPAISRADDLPEGKGRDVFARVCSTCHELEAATRFNGPKDIWQGMVDDMKARGADGTDADFALIVDYLSRAYGPAVKINSASAADISKELELSSAEADAIVAHRKDKGNFTKWADLQNVQGLDVKKLEPLKNRVKFQ